jgi:hypothetical protein
VIRRVAFAVAVIVVAGSCDAGPVTRALSPSRSPSSATASPGSVGSPTPDGKAAIVVRTPAPGDEVVAPVTVAGTADVFEATVSVRILDEDGVELATAFATATCGSGCRGRFRADVYFVTDRRQRGTIEVFESSAEDGSMLHVVSIPVVLVPGA